HERHDQQRAQQEQEQMLQLEPALMLLGGGDEVPHRRKGDRRRLAPRQQVEQDRDGRGDQAVQRPWVKKAHHAVRQDEASESRSTTPKGVSVVPRWYAIPWRRQANRHSCTTARTVASYAPAQRRGRSTTAARVSGSSKRASAGPPSETSAGSMMCRTS